MLDATRTGKRLIIAFITQLVAAGLLGGCAPKKPDSARDPQTWFIESYDHGTITARNEGKTYRAACEGHRILGPDQLVYDATPSFPCNMAIAEVGASIQPLTLGSDFHAPLLFMGHGPLGSLVLRRGDTVETFAVTSVEQTDR
jgi:hypothetical protein